MELNKECIALLRWIEKQPEPPTEEEVKKAEDILGIVKGDLVKQAELDSEHEKKLLKGCN